MNFRAKWLVNSLHCIGHSYRQVHCCAAGGQFQCQPKQAQKSPNTDFGTVKSDIVTAYKLLRSDIRDIFQFWFYRMLPIAATDISTFNVVHHCCKLLPEHLISLSVFAPEVPNCALTLRKFKVSKLPRLQLRNFPARVDHFHTFNGLNESKVEKHQALNTMAGNNGCAPFSTSNLTFLWRNCRR